MPRPKPAVPLRTVIFRLEAPLVERLDLHVRRMEKLHQPLRCTRTDAARDLLRKALEQVETAEAKKSR
jgi:hypothetical protein